MVVRSLWKKYGKRLERWADFLLTVVACGGLGFLLWMLLQVTSLTSFRKNYYFVGGDNVLYSQDSRYWGLLPEEYIVGRAIRIWKSVDKDTDEFRWNRLMKRIE